MKRNARLAFRALEKIGAPVYDRDDGYGTEFLLGAELRDNNDRYFADYYAESIRERIHPDDVDLPLGKRRILNKFGIHEDVWQILDKYDLWVEWLNGGLVGIYQR